MHWREEITPRLKKYGLIIYDPLKKPIDMANGLEGREKRHQWKQNGEFDKLAKWMKNIRHIDLRLCDKSDFGIVYIDMNIFSFGTLEELFELNRSKKPVLLMCKQPIIELSDWVFGTIPLENIFGNWDDLFDYLDDVDSNRVPDLGRWVFFSY